MWPGLLVLLADAGEAAARFGGCLIRDSGPLPACVADKLGARPIAAEAGNPAIRYQSEHIMAKPNFGFEKRQRELEKKRKKEEKLQRKLDKKNAPGEDEEQAAPEDKTE